ncbi:universal stress protein [Kitasatospora sp. NPDC001660]
MATRHVLTGIDGSPESETAAHWAAHEARERGTVLRLVHVWPWLATGATADAGTPHPSGLRPAALDALTGLAERLRATHRGLTVETLLTGDDPVDGLLDAAGAAELVVLGSRGLGGFAGLLVGSVGHAVTARSRVPVVLVRSRRPATGEGGIGSSRGEVLLGLDVRQPAGALLEFAFAEAGLRGVRLRVVHSWQLVPAGSYAGLLPPLADAPVQERAAAAALAQALEPWRDKYPDTEVIEELRLDGAGWSLVHSAAEHGAALVVVGRRERPLPVGPRLGPVAHAVVQHSPAPVAVVPHP